MGGGSVGGVGSGWWHCPTQFEAEFRRHRGSVPAQEDAVGGGGGEEAELQRERRSLSVGKFTDFRI